MANKLDIRVNVEGDNQTVSKFAAFEGGHVVFHNDAAAELTVSFAGTSPLCQGSNPQLSITVGAGMEKQMKVCTGVADQSFKYTATVAGATPEDPILIFDKKPILIYDSPGTIAAVAGSAGLLLGLLAGYLIAKRMMTRSGPVT
jgi:hypothetical protein